MRAAVPRLTEPAYLKRPGLTILNYPQLSVPKVEHGIAVFKDLHTGPPGPDAARELATALGASLDPGPGCVVVPIQRHTGVVRRVGRRDCEEAPGAGGGGAGGSSAEALEHGGPGSGSGQAHPECDGLVTRDAGVVLAVSVADCIPLFAVDPGGAVIGVAHCGWRGIVQGIVEEFAACLAKAHAKDALYLVGASIGRCCYEVRGDFLRCFPEQEVEVFASESAGRIRFDLKSLVASRLMRSGVGAEQISIDNTCTSCKKYILSSYRADGTKCGRMLAYLMIRD